MGQYKLTAAGSQREMIAHHGALVVEGAYCLGRSCSDPLAGARGNTRAQSADELRPASASNGPAPRLGVVFVIAFFLVLTAFLDSGLRTGDAADSAARSSSVTKWKDVGPLEETILRYTNQERRKRDMAPLAPSPALRYVARLHSQNMCSSGIFDHESRAFPDGWELFFERLKHVGIDSGGENIGYQTIGLDQSTWAKKMVDGWMARPAHRKNILDARFRYIGIGIHSCKNELGFATQVFSPEKGIVP